VTGAPAVESPPCVLCGGFAFRDLIAAASDRVTRKPGVFSVQACRQCALVMTRPRPVAQALGFYYQGTYSGTSDHHARSLQTGGPGRMAARYRLRAVRRWSNLGAAQRVLDVGCGYGTFCVEARVATGCQVTGIDMDAGCLAHALDREHVDYRCGTLESAGLALAQFDVVTFFESLEHHPDPVAALRAAHRLLKPGGLCVVEVPNFAGAWRHVFGSWWLPLLVPQHLVHFEPRTLRRAFELAGFNVPARHRAMFFPTESTASLGLWLNERLGRPIRSYRLRWRRPDGALLLLVLALWWAAIELPSQALLVLLGRSGHQLLVGRRST
jgi:SAM-dependent methyltransferase